MVISSEASLVFGCNQSLEADQGRQFQFKKSFAHGNFFGPQTVSLELQLVFSESLAITLST